MTAPKIITVGFDGPNGAGKGDHSRRLRHWLNHHDIPAMIVRGDGTRRGNGLYPGDPLSAWWQDINTWLRNPETSLEYWNVAAYRLGRELIVWRDRIFPNMLRAAGCERGVLIVDRTLLSRSQIPRALGETDIADNMYPERARGKGRHVIPDDVCPDLIFFLNAPEGVLRRRVEAQRARAEFRLKLIRQTASWFSNAIMFMPPHLRERVVSIDTSQPRDTTFREVLAYIKTLLL